MKVMGRVSGGELWKCQKHTDIPDAWIFFCHPPSRPSRMMHGLSSKVVPTRVGSLGFFRREEDKQTTFIPGSAAETDPQPSKDVLLWILVTKHDKNITWWDCVWVARAPRPARQRRSSHPRPEGSARRR